MTLETLREAILILGRAARAINKHPDQPLHQPRAFINKDNYRAELIQVAAVAVAALTDLDMQEGNKPNPEHIVVEHIWEAILDERERQDAKYNHKLPLYFDPLVWGSILMEELSEVVSEIYPL